ncbi:uncharacterized protein LOC122860694 [Aphidius gifuensis]|uniref:uncharacterized protein LOC122860694 n=1 Tax=Aphidius gifuensis TaxID=684658 RepID=UPI001CDBFB85|nr:uncharacterized protein LOC122860694 [Aphidius gifuensis]
MEGKCSCASCVHIDEETSVAWLKTWMNFRKKYLKKKTFHTRFGIMWKFIANRAPDSHCGSFTEEKTIADSISWRKIGNKKFHQISKRENYLSESIEAYTKSIAFAPIGSSELSLAYANRSAVLFKARLYQDCLLDIERALKSGYPDELKTKLFLRQAFSFKALDPSFNIESSNSMTNAMQWLPNLKKNCPNYNIKAECSKMMNQLEQPLDTNTVKFIPTIENNSIIVGGSDAIELKKTNDNKQHIVATRYIKAGEFIYVNKPFEMVPCDDEPYKTCWHCSRHTWAGVPCDQCPNVVFCSQQCKDSAWNEYHDIECPALSYSKKVKFYPGDDWQFQLAIKILSKALKAAGGIAQLKQKIDDVDSMEDKSMIYTDDIFDVNTIDNFHRLKYDKSAFDEFLFERTTRIISNLVVFGFKTNIFGRKMEIAETYANEDAMTLGYLIARYFMMVEYNVVYFTEKKSNDVPLKFAIIMPIQNMFVRDCNSHVDWYSYDHNVAVLVNKPIKKGEEVNMFALTSYLQVKKLSDNQLAFSKYDNEPCQCSECVMDSPPLRNQLPSYKSFKLSKKVRKELDRMVTKSRDYFKIIAEADPEKLLEIKDTYAELTDQVYQYVTVPCQELEAFQNMLASLYYKLSKNCPNDKRLREIAKRLPHYVTAACE